MTTINYPSTHVPDWARDRAASIAAFYGVPWGMVIGGTKGTVEVNIRRVISWCLYMNLDVKTGIDLSYPQLSNVFGRAGHGGTCIARVRHADKVLTTDPATLSAQDVRLRAMIEEQVKRLGLVRRSG